MKLLALGDFHGEFPKKFKDLVKKEKIDLVVSNGDYLPFHYRGLWFKHCYDSDVELWEVIGKKKYKELVLKDLRDGERALRGLNNIGVPVITTLGNIDYPEPDDVMDYKKPKGKKYWKWDWDRAKNFISVLKKYKNIHRIDYSYFKFEDWIFIGARGHTFPGRVKSKAYKKHRKILDKLFKKFRKENKKGKVIFLSHNVPYDTKLDKIGMDAHEKVCGKHYGSKLVRRIMDRWSPKLHLGGHIHEARGKQKLERTIMVNPGAVKDGEGAIIEILDKGKIKVRFVA